VLNYESTLEILDPEGKEAVFSKTEEVRFLQNNVIAFQDQAWGDGKILQDYQCSPGVPVDSYRFGHKTHILISLRDVMKKGDREKFHIRWKLKNGFLKPDGYWETDVNHYTQSLRTNTIFPKDRQPTKILTVEAINKRTRELHADAIAQLPDKRWIISWDRQNPKVNEQYILKWKW